MTTTQPITLDDNLKRFLDGIRANEGAALVAWAEAILKAGALSMDDLDRCFRLGFEGRTDAATVEMIARGVLGVACLVERKRDRDDFHDVHVNAIRRALDRAFAAGYEAGRSAR